MELRNLKTFQTAAEYLNFTKAAKILNFSQPTVTSQIRALEIEIKNPLFFRIGKQTYLTSQGEVMKRYVDQIFATLDEMNRELSKESRPASRLVIAASETFCTHYFPPIIRKFLHECPEVGIRLVSCYSKDVIAGIDSNDFDIGIISGTYRKSGITNIVIADHEDLVLIASKALHEKYPVSDILDKYPFIKYEIDGPFEQQMRHYIQEAGINSKKVIESSSLEAVKSAVMSDIGIGLISRNLVKKELAEKQLVEISLNKQPVQIKTSLIIAASKLSDNSTMRLISIIERDWNAIHDMAD
ncbi:LysR family transcriptional regulator [Sporolactobacillus putidus]|uniref:LysR family transcriptional regulator n=1 Tax=Sporolactobacillus putidus TaxID=492735 RepID=A0A917S4A2_9BACL|nr:LysR family transcriptional regulator [Sporolactobacillus putidus]GGL52499.1 LysR family transcriptional regulator [Sporolactobacillus putidus]